MERLHSIKFASRSWIICPRISLAKLAHLAKPIIRTIVRLSDPKMEEQAIAITIKGMESRATIRNMTTESTQPR